MSHVQQLFNGGESAGTFQLNFNNNRVYELFGREYLKCYANLSAKGKMSKPLPTGPLSYTVDFAMDCGCNSVLFDFNLAYKKTFGNQAQAPLWRESDYEAEIVLCQLVREAPANRLSNHDQFAEAEAFFNDVNLPDTVRAVGSDPYADKDGLVEFIVANELLDDPAVMAKLAEQKAYLIAITSVVTAYINRYAEAYGEQYKTDADLWARALSKIPLMGPSKIDQQSYSRHIKGLSIATDFINFIMDVVVSQGTTALASFNKFLQKQGDAIRFGVENNKDFTRPSRWGSQWKCSRWATSWSMCRRSSSTASTSTARTASSPPPVPAPSSSTSTSTTSMPPTCSTTRPSRTPRSSATSTTSSRSSARHKLKKRIPSSTMTSRPWNPSWSAAARSRCNPACQKKQPADAAMLFT